MRRLCLLAMLIALPAIAADRQSYVLRVGGRTLTNGPAGIEIEHLKWAYGPDFFWFRHAGTAYVVRETTALRALEDVVPPELDLADQQTALGKKQAALGTKQAALGAQQAGVGLQQASLAISSSDGDRQQELARQQEDLSRQQARLGEQQKILGDQQAELGNKMAALSVEVEKKLAAMIDDFVRRDVARRVSE
jgi:bla regulator protein blaR1